MATRRVFALVANRFLELLFVVLAIRLRHVVGFPYDAAAFARRRPQRAFLATESEGLRMIAMRTIPVVKRLTAFFPIQVQLVVDGARRAHRNFEEVVKRARAFTD